jgi:hypothetical protein
VTPDRASAPGGPRERRVAIAAVVLGAAGYFSVGNHLALGWALGWIDSGLVVYGSWRVSLGALPYRDFDHVYGPSLFYLNAVLLRLFGSDLAVVVTSLLVLKTALAVLVFVLARRVAGASIAAATTLLFVVVWGAPLWLFSAPYAQYYATLCALVALLLAARPEIPRRRALAAAGFWCGLAATFKITSGLFAGFALVLWALDETTGRPGTRAIRVVRAATVLVMLALGMVYAAGSLPSAAGVDAVVTVTVILLPFAAIAGTMLREELREPGDARGLGDVAVVAGVAAVAPLAWLAFFAAHGVGGRFLQDLVGLPPTLHWFEPLPVPSVLGICVVVATVLAAAGSRLATALAAVVVVVGLAAGLDGRPASIDSALHLTRHGLGRAAFELVAYVPILSVVIALPQVRRLASVPRLYCYFAAANLLLLLPAADVWHGFWLLPTVLPLVAALLGARPRRRLVLALVVVAVPFVVQLVTARASWETATARFTRAQGITHPDPKFDDVAALVRWLDAEPARNRPVLVLTAEAMIYFLAGRQSAFEREEYLLQTIVRGAASPQAAALLTDDEDFARRLAAVRPLIVDEPGQSVREQIRRLLPKTAAVLDAYTPRETFGRYAVLDR